MKNDDRYPGIAREWPKVFIVEGLNLERAVDLAEKLSNHEAGCDYAWYCHEDPEANEEGSKKPYGEE